jgi:hypothetical protein
MLRHEKLETIIKNHLGELVKFTIDFKRDRRTKLTMLYEDEYGTFYEYKLILNYNTEEIEFIKHKGSTLRREVTLGRDERLEQELYDFMISEICIC